MFLGYLTMSMMASQHTIRWPATRPYSVCRSNHLYEILFCALFAQGKQWQYSNDEVSDSCLLLVRIIIIVTISLYAVVLIHSILKCSYSELLTEISTGVT